MVNPIQFLREAKNELFKVVWPARREIIRITLAVILISLVVALFLGAVDFALSKLFTFILEKQ